MMNKFKEIFDHYPEMVLISKSPPTWKGVLTIINNFTNCEMKVKVKLVLPLFPSLDNASIYFGGSIAFLFSKKFKKQIDSILKRSESVVSLLDELKTTIEKLICDNQFEEIVTSSVRLDATKKLLNELNKILSESSEVQFLSNEDLSTIKLVVSDISITVRPVITLSGQISWKIISSDLPELPTNKYSSKKILSLKEIRNKFQKQVDSMEGVWEQLRKLDNYCWISDPINPKPYHLYRRINLSPTLSFIVTLNPMDPTGFPRIKFLGSKNEVDYYMDLIQNEDILEKWDLEYPVHENLLTILKLDEFPEAPQIEKPVEENCIFADEECCICFSMEIDGAESPNEVCGNYKCRRNFHNICLFQWLQESASNQIVFNQIFGKCPNCGEDISCSVPKS